jgi:hypothetical protein
VFVISGFGVEAGGVLAKHIRSIIVFTARAPVLGSQKVDRARAHGGKEEWIVLGCGGWLPPPEAHECILDDVFRVSRRGDPLPRVQQQFRRKLLKADAPTLI